MVALAVLRAARGDGVQPRLWYRAAAAGSARFSAKSAPQSVRAQYAENNCVGVIAVSPCQSPKPLAPATTS